MRGADERTRIVTRHSTASFGTIPPDRRRGMTVKAVDLWLLFPLGHAVNRLPTHGSVTTGAHADRPARLFGAEDWKEAFYPVEEYQASIFDESEEDKRANFDAIGSFFRRAPQDGLREGG